MMWSGKRYFKRIGVAIAMASLLMGRIVYAEDFATDRQILLQSDAQQLSNKVEATIMYPSDYQGTIAPGRDFYVIGSLKNGEIIPKNWGLKVSLYKNGLLQQEVEAKEKDSKENLWLEYPKLRYYDKSFDNNVAMPDLVYQGDDVPDETGIPKSFRDAWRKCYYTDKMYSAMFIGGEYDPIDMSRKRKDGSDIPKLERGVYDIEVNLVSPEGENIKIAEKSIKVDYSKDIILSRFSPVEHNERVSRYASENGIHILLDPFPGYWSETLLPEIRENDAKGFFGEIKQKWRLADAQEYIDSVVHCFLYNVTEGSATHNVEIGKLQEIGRIDEIRFQYYRYGEPKLDSVEGESPIEELPANKKVKLVRLDYGTKYNPEDNTLNLGDLNKLSHRILKDDVNSVTLSLGQSISLYGVCAPIQNIKDDVVFDVNEKIYNISNRIIQAKYYVIDKFGNEIFVENKPITGLSRTYRNGKVQKSVVEFYHRLELGETFTKGERYTIKVEFFDIYERLVDTEVLTIDISER